MIWFKLFVYSIVCYAISNMFVNAYGPFGIFKKIHDAAERVHSNLGELFSCMICFPTWVGFTLSALNMIFLDIPFTPATMMIGALPWYVVMFFDGMYASGITWLIHTWQESNEKQTSIQEEETKEDTEALLND